MLLNSKRHIDRRGNHKSVGFLSNTGPDPLSVKSQSYKASIQCWANIDDHRFIVVFGCSLPSSTRI